MKLLVEPIETNRGPRFRLVHDNPERWFVAEVAYEDEAALLSAAPELADALEEIRGRMKRWRAGGPECGPKGRDADWAELLTRVDAVLRKAGRMP